MIGDREAAFERAFAFIRELDRRASSRVERLPFGTAYLRPELPHVWSRNFVSVEAGSDDVDLDSVIDTTERVHLEARPARIAALPSTMRPWPGRPPSGSSPKGGGRAGSR